jgi:ADP-heptose:LPS heptosyltransferase
MHPGGEGLWGRKRWPVERFAQVADGLSDRLGARIVIMGGKDDAYLAADLASRTHADIINAAGQTTLGETAALAKRCALFIGNDSSPLHIAAAMGVPVVAIHGLTDPRSYHPWVPMGKEGVDYVVVRSPLPCAHRFPLIGGITVITWASILSCPALEAITPHRVLDAALSLIR